MERQTSRVYMTDLTATRLELSRQATSIRGKPVGNEGFVFGQWGKMPSKASVRERGLMQLKRQPAQIVCLAEAEELVEATWRSPAIETDSTGAASFAVAVETSMSTFDSLVARSFFE